MKTNFSASLTLVLKHEGGFSDDPRDPGNWTGGVLKGTMKGISAKAYPKLDIKNLSDNQTAYIYRRDYWDRIKGDELPSGVDYAVFDYAVNSGVRKASMELQRVASVADDGKIGPITLTAVWAMSPEKVVRKLCSRRIAFLKRLSIWPVYKNGWTRRVNDVRDKAISLVKSIPVSEAQAPKTSQPAKSKQNALTALLTAIAAILKTIFKTRG